MTEAVITGQQVLDEVRAVETRLETSFAAKVGEVKTAILTEVKQLIPASPAAVLADDEKEIKPNFGQLSKSQKKDLATKLIFMVNNQVRSFNAVEAKAMGIEVGENGGFLVPQEFQAEVLRILQKQSTFRNQARVWTGVGKKGSIPKETGTVSITYEGENVATSETNNPTLGQVIWDLKKGKGITKVPLEMLKFAAVDFLSLLRDMFADAIMVNEDNVFMNGNGKLRPTGLRQYTTGARTIAQAGASLAYDDFVNLLFTMPSQYRAEAVWLMHNDVMAKILKLKDTTGRALFTGNDESILAAKNLPPQVIGTILGKPVFENNFIPQTLGSGDKSEIWLSALKRAYGIFEEGPMELSMNDSQFFTSDQIVVKVLFWHDGKPTVTDASAYLSGVK